ncbi:MAG: hypothetical protein ACI9TH_002297 [Kiritimatiellia bacterium]|jgi:hypothetical protein
MLSERVCWTAAVLSMAAGVTWVTFTALQADQSITRLKGQGQRLSALQKMQAEAGHNRAAIATVERAQKKNTTDLPALAAIYLPGISLAFQPVEEIKLPDGWVLHTQALQAGGLNAEQLSLLVEKAEAQRPPWRVEHIELEPDAAGNLRGELRFQNLQKHATGT